VSSLSTQFLRYRPLSRTPAYVQDAHDLCIVVNREEDTVRVRLTAVRRYADRMFRIEALGRDGTPLWMLVQPEDCPFETVEPSGSLLWRPFDHPSVECLEVGLGATRDLNAGRQACDAAA